MSTLADIRKCADSEVFITGSDVSVPEGSFGATARVLGQIVTYILEGEVSEDAEITSRLELEINARYEGSGIKGGTYMGTII